jgi:hypothetical protein
MSEEKTVMELLEELKKDPELHPDPEAREALVENLIYAMIRG